MPKDYSVSFIIQCGSHQAHCSFKCNQLFLSRILQVLCQLCFKFFPRMFGFFSLYISSFPSNYHLCFLVLLSRRLFCICNNFFLFSNGSFFKVSHYCFTEAISSQISLKNINLRGCTLFRLSALLSPECSVTFWVIFLLISSQGFFCPWQVLQKSSTIWPSLVVHSYLMVMQMNAPTFPQSSLLFYVILALHTGARIVQRGALF